MADPFVHLHVASGYSLRHGASHPADLVQRAADHGMDTLALTDRDGVYGAVKFVTACTRLGVRPILGTDLAYGAPPPKSKTPARGGAFVDHKLPRITVLAKDKRGWASVCRLVSATHLAGERGEPVTTLDLVAAHIDGLVVLLGPDSAMGRALARRRPDLAKAELDHWRHALVDAGAEPYDVVVEVVDHRGPGDAARAGRMLAWAREIGAPAVLTNAARGADRSDGPTLDVLDAARRLVALDARHIDRVNAEAYLKSGKEMDDVAAEIAHAAGLGERAARDLLASTRRLADRCVLDPRDDLGIGTVHFPDLGVDGDADAILRQQCEAGLGRRGMTLTP